MQPTRWDVSLESDYIALVTKFILGRIGGLTYRLTDVYMDNILISFDTTIQQPKDTLTNEANDTMNDRVNILVHD
jgi:hypothetical protein